MIKVLYIVSTLERCGPTRQLLNIIKYLDKDIFKPYVVTLSPEPENSMWKEYETLDIDLNSANLNRVKGIFLLGNKIEKLIRIINPDIIHTQGLRADFLSATRDYDKPRFSTQRNYPYHDYGMFYGKIKGYLFGMFHYKIFRYIDNVVACSKTVSTLNKNHKLHTDYIQNGVDLETVNCMKINSKEYYRNKLNIPKNKKMFVVVGSLIPRKAPEIIIEAFKKLVNADDYLLYFIGDGHYKDECMKLSENIHTVCYTGFKENITGYLSAADGYISASRSEGLPNTVIEALAYKLPVILSDIPSHREILEINPKAGVLFTIDNIWELKKNIEQFKPNKENAEAAWDIVKSTLNADTMSKGYQRKYLQSVNKQ